MTPTELTTFAAVTVVAVVVGGTFLYSRANPRGAIGSFQYLVDELAGKNQRIIVLEHKVTVLEAQVVELTRQNHGLQSMFNMVMNQNTSPAGKTHHANTVFTPSGSTNVSVQPGEEVVFRVWVGAHFDSGELKVLAADAELTEPKDGNPQEMAADLVFRAKRVGRLGILSLIALERRPNVPRWKA